MEKVWLNSYEEGVAHQIDLSKFDSLVDFAESCFEEHGDKVAYTCMGKGITYRELDKYSKAFANYLMHDLKLQKGDRVGVMLPNVLQFPIAIYGIHRAGMVSVNINPLYTPRELNHVLKDSDTKALLVLENFAKVAQDAVEGTVTNNILTTAIGDMLGGLKGTIVNFVIRKVKKMVPAYSLPQAVDFKKSLELGAKHEFNGPKVTQEDVAFLQYTGGTTGVAKGAILTHKNMLANVMQAMAWIDNLVDENLEGGIVTALPLYHIFSLTANCLTFLKVGIPNILITNPRDIPGFVKELKKNPFAVMTGVNTLFNALLRNKDFQALDFSKFRFTLGGGMAVQSSVAKRWREVTGVPLIEAYGLTEASPAVTINPMNLPDYNGSIGLPLPSTDVSIRDENNQEVGFGEPGELCVKGPQVMRGYWKDEEKTKEAFTEDGWLKTGDMATMDNNGFVYIVDRKKDMITVSGFKVYPNEVEDVIASIPGVVEVAVIGIEDERYGERVCAYVVSSDESVTKETILAECKKNLTNYKMPRQIEFKDELPKTPVGKVLRRALREQVIQEGK